jgi:RNA polymerase sigma-54 factor
MKTALQFRLNQQLALTPQLQQAIRLLQLSQLELEAELRQLAESNPLLEFAEDAETGDEGDFAAAPAPEPATDGAGDGEGEWVESEGAAEEPIDFSSIRTGSAANGRDDEGLEPQNAAPETLQEHLLWQLNLSPFDARQRAIATVLIDALNDDGYLAEGPESVLAALPADLRASLDEVESVRRQLQRFDPTGVASLNLRDCLRVQLEQFDPDATPQRGLALRIVDHELDLLARNDIPRLARRLRADEDEAAAAAALIRSLDPRPGAALDATPVEYVAPDVCSRWPRRSCAGKAPSSTTAPRRCTRWCCARWPKRWACTSPPSRASPRASTSIRRAAPSS